MDLGDIIVTRKKFAALADNMILGLLLVDENMIISYANPKAEKMFEYISGELNGQVLEVLIPEDKRAVHKEHFAGFMKNPDSRLMGEGRGVSGRKRSGELIKVEIVLCAFSDEGKRYAWAIIREIK
jgi:PAS domain S-box-containing protein